MKIEKSIVEINYVLDKGLGNISRLNWAIDRIGWLAKFRKVPKTITDALATKAIAIMDGTWYVDEEEQTIISNYIKECCKC